MSRDVISPGQEVASALSGVDWTNPSEADQVRVEAAIHEVLVGGDCKCNGETLAVASVATTVSERIRAVAVARRVDIGIRELAVARGVDLQVATPAEITVASTPDEVNSLIVFESVITQETIEQMVTNDEMAVIQAEVLGKTRRIRDADWHRDLSQFVRRAIPHSIEGGITNAGLTIVQTVAIKLDTLTAEVDDNGEICCWTYEEPEV